MTTTTTTKKFVKAMNQTAKKNDENESPLVQENLTADL